MKSNAAELDETDEAWDQVQATIRLVVDGMPEAWRPVVALVGMHEAYLAVPLLKGMAEQVEVGEDANSASSSRSAGTSRPPSAGIASRFKERSGDDHGAATTYHQLGSLESLRGRRLEAAHWFLRALPVFVKLNSQQNAQIVAGSFFRNRRDAEPGEQDALRRLWEEAGLPWPEELEEEASASAD